MAVKFRPVFAVISIGALLGCTTMLGINEDYSAKSLTDAGGDSAPAPPATISDPDTTVGDTSDAGTTGTPIADSAPPSMPARPPEGNYEYSISGGDQLSGFFGNTATYGPTAAAQLKHKANNCFDISFKYRPDYDEVLELCIEGMNLVSRKGSRVQKFGFIGASTTLSCDAGDVYFTPLANSASSFAHDCTGKNADDKSGGSAFRTAGPYRFLGIETITTSRGDHRVLHFHDERAVTGNQTGTNVADWYFAQTDMRLIRLKRNVDISYPSIVGTIRYTENLDLILK